MVIHNTDEKLQLEKRCAIRDRDPKAFKVGNGKKLNYTLYSLGFLYIRRPPRHSFTQAQTL